VTMSMTIQIRLDLASLRRSSTGMVSSILFVEVNGFCFPEHSWNDFPVIVLGWWLDEAFHMCVGSASVRELLFMDGRFSLRISKIRGKECTLSFMDSSNVVFEKTSVLWRNLVDGIVVSARQLYYECIRREWRDNDVELLKVRADRIASLLGY
jgi:hypothetical protein